MLKHARAVSGTPRTGEKMTEVGQSRHALLAESAVETYRAVAAGEKAADEAAVAELHALQLLTDDPYCPGRHLARDPRSVARELMTSALADLTATVERISQIPAVQGLANLYDPHRFYGGPGSEYLGTPALMNARIGPLTDASDTEIYTAQPGEPADRDPETLRGGAERTADACRRGVQVRSLYTARVADHPQTSEHVDTLVEAGAEIRVLGTPFPRMVLLDRLHLFIDNFVVEGAEAHSGWHVSDRSAVMWARSIFADYWSRATPWQALSRAATDAVSTARQRAVLRELEAGQSQRQAGARLRMAERTVAKELAALRDRLGVRTLYQILVWWGRTPERDLP
ncbi:LuxR C-terminal-related transcriptional regulator [Streptomyces sp. AM 2-1-1]|uniref:LuxR C-terminal-related transcriptional regulator n=1 Tax=Streptomyces sp. AM 2-1-1 TaxID=3028709 RepID=UPI0023B9578F|nr:LuxR C-terminal-related transcriptional regulator [Streptomyces sp. AM 2-1-1]WEH40820.1 LuxR C-terminal-related transcriptional regulator [Streptomyces sp. AM 2-1-1]